MEASEVLATLREHASGEVRALMEPRYGIHVNEALGVSMADMKRLARGIGRDHDLAASLWATGIYEARVLAGLVDEPSAVTIAQMDTWCSQFDNWAICDTVCFTLFDRVPLAWTRLEPWASNEAEFVRRASFALLWSLALHDKKAPDQEFVKALDLAELYANDSRPLVTKAISMSLRAVGKRNSVLRAAVVATAERLAGSSDRTTSRIGRTALRDFSAA